MLCMQGMGKTVEMIALILTQRGPIGMPTLIVCPTPILSQWAAEIKRYVTEAADLKVLVHHGEKRCRDPAQLMKYDVVITSYGVLTMEATNVPVVKKKIRGKTKVKKKDPKAGPKTLGKVEWFRIVLDECHVIRNATTQGSLAASSLKALRRWCMSGTCLQNKYEDLMGYYRFLRHKPFNWESTYKLLVTRSLKGDSDAYTVLRKTFAAIALRRDKSESNVRSYEISDIEF